MFQETNEGKINHCPICEARAREVEELKDKTKEFNWGKFENEKILPIAFISQAYTSGKNERDDVVILRIAKEMMERIKTHCVPRENYESSQNKINGLEYDLKCAEQVAEYEHNEAVCLQNKLERIKKWTEIEVKGEGNAEENNFSFGLISGIIQSQDDIKKIICSAEELGKILK